MAGENVTMTAARAIIKKDGVPIGFMKSLRITESKQRGTVMGLGQITKRERPILSITCTWSCDFYLIDLKTTGIPGLDNREVQTVEQYKDTQVLLNPNVDIVVYKKDIQTVTNGVVTQTKNDVFCTIRNITLDSTSWDVSEQQISGFQQSGEYTTPVILSI